MIVAGFGFRRGVTLASLRDALAQAADGHPAPQALAAPADKAGELIPLADRLCLTVIPVGPAALTGMDTATHSAASLAARRTGSVAEASALAAAGPRARLLVTRRISFDRMATCALALGVST